MAAGSAAASQAAREGYLRMRGTIVYRSVISSRKSGNRGRPTLMTIPSWSKVTMRNWNQRRTPCEKKRKLSTSEETPPFLLISSMMPTR